MKKLSLFFIGVLVQFFAIAQNESSTTDLRTRQVHLDFHTSEFIPNIGEKFNKKQFQEALQVGHVNQINVFAKCCHSWSYYPTKVGKQHPNLSFDLLGAQIEACHEIGVKCPIYYIVGWSANDAKNHPEWRAQKLDGSYIGEVYDYTAADSVAKPFNSWPTLCWLPDGPYHKHILKQVEEICQKYDADGFWFDMYHILPRCYCENCLGRYKREGINVLDTMAVEKSMAKASSKHMEELTSLVKKYHPKASIFFNATPHINKSQVFEQKLYTHNTQQELEDLPTTWGGYDKLPLEAKYHLALGNKVVAMSGKFHKAWGEFGGFKHSDAIKYEAAAMISFGAACNFGDQLHPSGLMDMETYKNIGEAYKYVEKIEKYGIGGIPVSKLGIWLSLDQKADYGLVNMLLETHNDFVIADENNLQSLKLLLIPSKAQLNDKQAAMITKWTNNGGKIIAFGKGIMDSTQTKFLLDIGASYQGKSNYKFDYTRIESALSNNVVSSPFLNYESGIRIQPNKAKVLANIIEPYFDRTYGKYSSHRETPYSLNPSKNPAIIQYQNIIYFAHDLDKLYYDNAVRMHRQLFSNAVDLLNKEANFKINNLPSSGRVSFLKQVKENRYVAHLLYAPALKRGDVMLIEDFLPVPNTSIEVNVPEKIKAVYQIPENKKLDFTVDNGIVKVNVPTFTMHTAIVLEY